MFFRIYRHALQSSCDKNPVAGTVAKSLEVNFFFFGVKAMGFMIFMV